MSGALKSIMLITALLVGIPIKADSIWQIQEIQGESDEKTTIITVNLDRDLQTQNIKLEEHGTFIQVLVPQAHVLQPGQFIDGNSPIVRKIAAFQINDKTAGLRLFVAEDAAKVMPAVSVDILGSRLLIHIEHDRISTKVKEEEIPFSGVPSAEEVIRRTEVRQNIVDPATRTHENADALPMIASEGETTSLQQKLEWVTAASALAFLAMTLFIKYRRRWMKKSGDHGDGPAFSMKTLATFPLAPKQRITLVEVAGQKILLGVSPENINFLTEIQDPTTHAKRSQQILDHITQNKSQIRPSAPIVQKQVAPKMPLAESEQRTVQAKNYAGEQAQGEAFATNLSGATKRQGAAQQAKTGAPSAGSNKQRTYRAEPNSTQERNSHHQEPSSIEDVTNLIRRKLKDLPKI